MISLQTFLNRITGTHTNDKQQNIAQLPKAIHIVTPCNERIKNRPYDFNGIFVIDETYYDYGSHRMELHHVYCYQEIENGDIRMISYCIPDGIEEKDLCHEFKDTIDFASLCPKHDIAPIIYTQKNDMYFCEGWNKIAPELDLHVVMEIYHDYYTVIEACYQNGMLVSGFEEAVCYQKVL